MTGFVAMSILPLFSALMVLPGAAASGTSQVCGLLLANHSNGKLETTIADLVSYSNKQRNYKILNPYSFEWTAGSCLCVLGPTRYDPDFGSDYLYMTVHVDRVVSEDLSGRTCLP